MAETNEYGEILIHLCPFCKVGVLGPVVEGTRKCEGCGMPVRADDKGILEHVIGRKDTNEDKNV